MGLVERVFQGVAESCFIAPAPEKNVAYTGVPARPSAPVKPANAPGPLAYQCRTMREARQLLNALPQRVAPFLAPRRQYSRPCSRRGLDAIGVSQSDSTRRPRSAL